MEGWARLSGASLPRMGGLTSHIHGVPMGARYCVRCWGFKGKSVFLAALWISSSKENVVFVEKKNDQSSLVALIT